MCSCAAIAIGCDVFRGDVNMLVEFCSWDTRWTLYSCVRWLGILTLYLPVVMSLFLTKASAIVDISV